MSRPRWPGDWGPCVKPEKGEGNRPGLQQVHDGEMAESYQAPSAA